MIIPSRSAVFTASYSPCDKYVVCGCEDGMIYVFLSLNSQLLYEFKGHDDYINTATYSNDNKYIVTSSQDKTAKIFEVDGYKLVYTVEDHTANVTAA